VDCYTNKYADAGWNFDNSYARLPEVFYARLNPHPVAQAQLVLFNTALAKLLGLNPDVLNGDNGAELFSGQSLPQGAEPLAQAYAGHQFGHFTLLGDGRALLLGEHVTAQGARFDIQYKGSGKTPFSRRGDGRAALGPMLREYIISEALYALGIPTTRSLAVVTTGEAVYRETALAGAILTRVAASHIRVGTFEYAAAKCSLDDLKALADYTIDRHYPEALASDNRYLYLLRSVVVKQASLVAQWGGVGFIHGVMNTDNMTLSGETIDYGPCAFIDRYDPHTVFSSIDHNGRYAFGRQAQIAQWNLSRFAEALLPLIHADSEKALTLANVAISEFSETYRDHWLTLMRSKLGLLSEEGDDVILAQDLLDCMYHQQMDFTNTFRALGADSLPQDGVFQSLNFRQWFARWQARLKRQDGSLEQSRQLMNRHNPAVIPRNHIVEEAIAAAVNDKNYTPVEELLGILSEPYTHVQKQSRYQQPAPLSAAPYQTFCGT
jgi:uncharacterized protein YdiU (UPF0061 family)